MQLVDVTLYGSDEAEKQLADAKLAFLTPIVKAFLTETAQEATSYGIQVYGGHGSIKEWGMCFKHGVTLWSFITFHTQYLYYFK